MLPVAARRPDGATRAARGSRRERNCRRPATATGAGASAAIGAAIWRRRGNRKTTSTLETVAWLCTEFGRVIERSVVRELLQESADRAQCRRLDRRGWPTKPEMRRGRDCPRLFRESPCAPSGGHARRRKRNRRGISLRQALRGRRHGSQTAWAPVVPMLIPDGCAGALAIELQPGVGSRAAIPSALLRCCSPRR